MGLSQAPEKVPLYGNLTGEEKAQMYPSTGVKCVMRSGDSPPPFQAQASIPSAYDVPDDAGTIGKAIFSSSTTSTRQLISESVDSDTELTTSIEQAVPVVRNTLSSSDLQPKTEQNGVDRKYADEKITVDDWDVDSRIVNCVHFTQKCCECAIM